MEERPPVPERREGLLKGPRSISPSTFPGCLSAPRYARRSGRPTFYPGQLYLARRPRDHFKLLVLCLMREGLGRRAWLGGRAGGGPETAGSKQPCVLWDHLALGRNPPPLCAFRRGERVWVFLFFLFQFYSECRRHSGFSGISAELPLNSQTYALPRDPPKDLRSGEDLGVCSSGWREGKKGVICKIASCLRGEGEITDRYDLGVFACLQKLQ